VTIPIDDEGREDAARATSCAGCGARLGSDQRYCLECGTRRAPLPPLVAARIGAFEARGRDGAKDQALTGAGAAAAAEAEGEAAERPTLEERFMPGPRVAAVAVMGLLAFGVFLGSATSPLAQSAGIAPILLDGSGSSSSPSGPTEEASTPAATPEAAGPAAPSAPAALVPESSAPPEEGLPGEEGGQKPAIPPEVEPPPPSVKHVFLIVLTDQGFDEAFGESSSAPYLAKTLRGQGELLANYYAVAGGELANEVALLSGQGPTPQTAANCPDYAEISPGKVGAEEQAEGSGCVYPPATQTLPGQLAAAGKTWKAYVEGIGNGGAGQPGTCRHPALGSPDGNQAPLPGDAYETWLNPFVYFDSLTDGPECAQDDVGIEQLQPDLQSASSTPSFSYIAPSACHDGSEKPCEPGAPAGLAAAEPFLKAVVPEIEASPAYKEGGLIAITSDQAPQTGPNADSSSCCGVPQYPNLPAPPSSPTSDPVKPTGGGGRVGLLLISPYVKPGSVYEKNYYNHFSLLHSIEELFGLQPLGYAANPALTGFESGVYNNAGS
jgi:phosphatidylinositol-3-phosphatase